MTGVQTCALPIFKIRVYRSITASAVRPRSTTSRCMTRIRRSSGSASTKILYGKAGISLPRTAQAQYDATQHLPLSQAKAGDLVFFHSTYNAGSYVTHVGILVSPTQMYHAGDPIGYADLSSSYWQQHLIGAGRVKQ